MPYLLPRQQGQPDAWAEEAARHGGTGRQQLREVAEVIPPANVAELLKTPAGEPTVVRRRIMFLDDRPVELTDSYYPATIARGTALAEARKIPGGATTLLVELGYPPRHAQEDVAARPPDSDERHLLELRPGEWVLVLSRLVMTDTELATEASVMTMIARDRQLRYRLSL